MCPFVMKKHTQHFCALNQIPAFLGSDGAEEFCLFWKWPPLNSIPETARGYISGVLRPSFAMNLLLHGVSDKSGPLRNYCFAEPRTGNPEHCLPCCCCSCSHRTSEKSLMYFRGAFNGGELTLLMKCLTECKTAFIQVLREECFMYY